MRTATDTLIPGKGTTGLIYGIAKGWVYKLRVMGFSKGGNGKKSPEVYFTLGNLISVI